MLLWCIKDRDPKQAERKVLSFQRHYSIPPPVSRPDLLFFGFCFLFVTLGGSVKCMFGLFVQSFCIFILFYIGASGRLCSPLSVPAQSAGTPPPQGEASVPASIAAKFVVRQSPEMFILPQSISLFTGVHLAPPAGELARSA